MNKKEDVALENFRKGTAIVRAHPLFGQLIAQCTIIRKDKTNTKEKNYCPEKGWAVVVDNAQIYVHPTRRGEPEEWAFVLAHCVLHLGLEHFKVREKPNEWNAACCAFVTRFLEGMKFGRAPVELSHNQPILSKPEEWLYNEFSRSGVPEDLAALSVGGQGVPDLWFTTSKSYIYQKQWAGEFASAIQKAVTETISKSATTIAERRLDTRGERARNWFVNHYPLLGALAATFEIVEDSAILERMDIGLGAVEPAARRIYINTMRLNEGETKFVMAMDHAIK